MLRREICVGSKESKERKEILQLSTTFILIYIVFNHRNCFLEYFQERGAGRKLHNEIMIPYNRPILKIKTVLCIC